MDRPDMRRAVWGLALIGAGIVLLYDRLVGTPDWLANYEWWGGLVVALGLITLVTASKAESVGTGVTLILLGLWFILVTNRMFGFRWYNSWPLALVAAGAGTVAHAIAAHWLPDTPKVKNQPFVKVELGTDDSRRRHERPGEEGSGHA